MGHAEMMHDILEEAMEDVKEERHSAAEGPSRVPVIFRGEARTDD